MSLGIACVVLAEWLARLAMLESALLWRPEGVGTSWWTVPLWGITVLGSWRGLTIALLAVLALRGVTLLAIAVLAVALLAVALLTVALLTILVVRVRHDVTDKYSEMESIRMLDGDAVEGEKLGGTCWRTEVVFIVNPAVAEYRQYQPHLINVKAATGAYTLIAYSLTAVQE